MLYLDTEITGRRPPQDDLVEVVLVAELCRPAEPWMQRGRLGGLSFA
jgi:hypothetical protein